MYVIGEHFYSASVLNMKTKLLPQYSSRLQNSPLSLFGKELRSSFPKEKILSPAPPPLPLPPRPQKGKLTCMITKTEMQCSVSRLLSFSSVRRPRILRHLTSPGQHEKLQKSRTTIHLFLAFPSPQM